MDSDSEFHFDTDKSVSEGYASLSSDFTDCACALCYPIFPDELRLVEDYLIGNEEGEYVIIRPIHGDGVFYPTHSDVEDSEEDEGEDVEYNDDSDYDADSESANESEYESETEDDSEDETGTEDEDE